MNASTDDLFYEATARLGGRIDPVYAPTAIGWLMDEFRKIAEPSLPGHVHFNYIGSSEINAVAFTHKSHEFVGINLGTVLVAYDVFLSLLAHHSFAPDIGGPSSTVVHFQGVLEKIRFAQSGGHGRNKPKWLADISRDPVRRAYAEALAFCALDFILQHELAHLEMGHLEYLNSRRGITELFERRLHNGRLWERAISQSCEVDADRAATRSCLSRLCRFHALRVPPGPPATFVHVLHHPESCYRAWHTSVAMTLFVLGLDGVGVGAGSDGSHPHPYLRSLLIYHTGLLDVREHSPSLEAAYQAGYEKVTTDLVPVWTEMAGREFVLDYVGTTTELETVWRRLVARIGPVWNELSEATKRRRERLHGAQ